MAITASRRSVVRAGWLPAALLILGLGAVAVIVSGSPDVSLSSLRHYRSDWGVYPVGSYPGGWWDYPGTALFLPIIGGRAHNVTVAFSIVYLGAATALGSFVVDGLRGDDHWPRAVSALAGFLPGYLMLLAPLQLLFAAVPIHTAARIAVFGLPIVVVGLHRHTLAGAARSLRYDRAWRRQVGASIVVVIVLVAVAATHRLQAGNFFMTQDSVLWWVVGAAGQLRGDFGNHLAQWNQQTDEWLFSAPLMFSYHTRFDSLFTYYATQCLSLVSFACLVFGMVHRLAWRRTTLAACVATGFVLASTPLIYPWRYITIIGGDNPALWTGQTGRQLGIIAPWVALLMIGRQRRPTMIAAGLAAAGLAFTSIQNLGFVLAVVSCGLLWRTSGGQMSTWTERRGVRDLAYLFPVATIAMIVFAFWWLHHSSPPAAAAWWLLASAAIAVIGAVAIALGTPGRDATGPPKGRWVWIGAWVAAMAGGLLLSNNSIGNILGGGPRHVLSLVLPGYGGPLVVRPDIGENVSGKLTFPAVSDLGCKNFNYCVSFADFLASFGFLFVVLLATWIAFGRMTSEAPVNARRAAWLLMVAAVAVAFVIIFFTGAPTQVQPNIYSRLLDAPYYGLLALAAMTFVGSSDRATAIIGTAVIVVWSVTPLIGSRWPQQMLTNGEWLVHRAGLS
jgi:hypothetical protein